MPSSSPAPCAVPGSPPLLTAALPVTQWLAGHQRRLAEHGVGHAGRAQRLPGHQAHSWQGVELHLQGDSTGLGTGTPRSSGTLRPGLQGQVQTLHQFIGATDVP